MPAKKYNLIKKPAVAIPAGLIEVPSYPGSTYMHLWPHPKIKPHQLSIEARVAIAQRPIDPHMPNVYGRWLQAEAAEEAAKREEIRKAEAARRIAALTASIAAKREADPAAYPVREPKGRSRIPATEGVLRAASQLKAVASKAELDATRKHIYGLIKAGADGITMSEVRKANEGKPVQASIEKLIALGAVVVTNW